MRHLALALACLPILASQAPNPLHLAIPRLAQAPSMARDADLSTWKEALVLTEFGMIMPDDKGENRWPTIVHVGWGPDALYVAVEARDPEPSKIHAARHMRDTNNGDFDFVGVDLDPSGKGQSIARFFVTPLGGQIDEIMTDSTGENASYNCLWDSTGVLTPDGYVVKMRIPYSSLRRRPGDWAFRILRIIPRERRYGISWPRMSKDVQCDICQMARVSGAPVDKPGSPFLVIPFATYNRTQSLETNPGAPVESKARLGMDVRYATTALTFEGTYRPDFATADADVDPLQINSRFKVLYPERRPFFLEGMDLLSPPSAQRQFFSRSIQSPLFGLKASGQGSLASWTLLHAKDDDGGLMLSANGAQGVEGLPTRDTAAALRFQLDGRGSGLSFLGTDKRLMGGPDSTGGQSGGLYLDQYPGLRVPLHRQRHGRHLASPPDGRQPPLPARDLHLRRAGLEHPPLVRLGRQPDHEPRPGAGLGFHGPPRLPPAERDLRLAGQLERREVLPGQHLPARPPSRVVGRQSL